jgi:hypothetical protein
MPKPAPPDQAASPKFSHSSPTAGGDQTDICAMTCFGATKGVDKAAALPTPTPEPKRTIDALHRPDNLTVSYSEIPS